MAYPSAAADCAVSLGWFSLRAGGTGGEFHDGKRFAANSGSGEAKDRTTHEIEASVANPQPRHLGCYAISGGVERNPRPAPDPSLSLRSGLRDRLGAFLGGLSEVFAGFALKVRGSRPPIPQPRYLGCYGGFGTARPVITPYLSGGYGDFRTQSPPYPPEGLMGM